MRPHWAIVCGLRILLLALDAVAQQPASAVTLDEELPSASLWEKYSYRMQASGGVGPYRWILLSGSLPRGLELHEFGELAGVPDESGAFEFTVLIRDSNNPPEQEKKKFILPVETPMSAAWNHTVRVSGQRIDGSIKVSNRTGRDFDLTVIVLAVNDIGRATAIGYQHFPLKKDTKDFDIPFGDTVSRGTYAVNVDVVGKEPVSNHIFRARLVTGQRQVTQGP